MITYVSKTSIFLISIISAGIVYPAAASREDIHDLLQDQPAKHDGAGLENPVEEPLMAKINLNSCKFLPMSGAQVVVDYFRGGKRIDCKACFLEDVAAPSSAAKSFASMLLKNTDIKNVLIFNEWEEVEKNPFAYSRSDHNYSSIKDIKNALKVLRSFFEADERKLISVAGEKMDSLLGSAQKLMCNIWISLCFPFNKDFPRSKWHNEAARRVLAVGVIPLFESLSTDKGCVCYNGGTKECCFTFMQRLFSNRKHHTKEIMALAIEKDRERYLPELQLSFIKDQPDVEPIFCGWTDIVGLLAEFYWDGHEVKGQKRRWDNLEEYESEDTQP